MNSRRLRLVLWCVALSVFLYGVIGEFFRKHLHRPIAVGDIIEVSIGEGVHVDTVGGSTTLTRGEGFCHLQRCGAVRLKSGSPVPVRLRAGRGSTTENWTSLFGFDGARIVRDDGTLECSAMPATPANQSVPEGR